MGGFHPYGNLPLADQWQRHLQQLDYVSDIGQMIASNRRSIEQTLKTGTRAQVEAINSVCGNLDEGFGIIEERLQGVIAQVGHLRMEVSAMAAMLDWRMSLLVQEQRITNVLLQGVANLLRIPEKHKERVDEIERGLKYLRSALASEADGSYYEDALHRFKKAEGIENQDYFTLSMIGFIYLFSPKLCNLKSAEDYLLRAARESLVEHTAGGTTSSRSLRPTGNLSVIKHQDHFLSTAAESYWRAAWACFLQGESVRAAAHAGKAFRLIPEFASAGFDQAVYLVASGEDEKAAEVLDQVVQLDRNFAIAALADEITKECPPVLRLLQQKTSEAVSQSRALLEKCLREAASNSQSSQILLRAEALVKGGSFTSCLEAIDLLREPHVFSVDNRMEGYEDSDEIELVTNHKRLTVLEVIRHENSTNSRARVSFDEKKRAIAVSSSKEGLLPGGLIGVIAGLVMGFARSCDFGNSRELPSLDYGLTFRLLIGLGLAGCIIGALIGYFTARTPKIVRRKLKWGEDSTNRPFRELAIGMKKADVNLLVGPPLHTDDLTIAQQKIIVYAYFEGEAAQPCNLLAFRHDRLFYMAKGGHRGQSYEGITESVAQVVRDLRKVVESGG